TAATLRIPAVSRGFLLASDDAESAACPTVDKGSGSLGTPPVLQRVPHAHGEATALARHAPTERSSIGSDREGLGTKHALSPTASLPSGVATKGLQRALGRSGTTRSNACMSRTSTMEASLTSRRSQSRQLPSLRLKLPV